MSCTERNNKIFTTPCLLVGPQRLVSLFAFCICILNVTRHSWLDNNPQEAIFSLNWKTFHSFVDCFSHWPQMHTSYPKTHSCVFEFVLCILHLYLCLFFLLTSCCVLLTSAHTHVSQGKRESGLLLLGQTLLITRVHSRKCYRFALFQQQKIMQ